MPELTEQEERRREELAALQEADINPYGYAWDVDNYASHIIETFDDALHQADEEGVIKEPFEVSIAGRMMKKRVMGKASFIELQDSSGTVQVYVARDELPEGFTIPFSRNS